MSNFFARAKSSAIDRFFGKQPRIRRLVTRVLVSNRDQLVDICGTNLFINTRAENGYLRASRLVQQSSLLRYEMVVLINLAFLLEPGDTFVDAGANVGFYAHTVARFAKIANLKTYAFEPHPKTYHRLTSIDDGVIAEQCAIADGNGTLEFCEGAVSNVFANVRHTNQYSIPGQTIRVSAKRLDECVIEGNSLVMKFDVEGGELEALQGAEGLFREERVKVVYVDGYESNGAVPEYLKSHGFCLYDGRTLDTQGGWFSLMAVHPDKFRLK
jgi:FkbM family methyltransferase